MLRIGMKQALLEKIAADHSALEEAGRVMIESPEKTVATDGRRLMVVGTPAPDTRPYPNWRNVLPDLDDGYTYVLVDAMLLAEMLALIPEREEGRRVCVLAAPKDPYKPLVLTAPPGSEYPCLGLFMTMELAPPSAEEVGVSPLGRLRRAVQGTLDWARES